MKSPPVVNFINASCSVNYDRKKFYSIDASSELLEDLKLAHQKHPDETGRPGANDIIFFTSVNNECLY
jgi:hypothetical protein